MFEPINKSRVYGVPIGTNFSEVFVSGFLKRTKSYSPTDIASVTIYVNTRRIARRMLAIFQQQNAMFIPKLRVFSDLSKDLFAPIKLKMPQSDISRHIELAKLVKALIEQEPELAPTSSIFALSQSLGDLMNEMHLEGVSFDQLKNISVGNVSEHWERSLKFLNIIAQYWDTQDFVSKDERQRAVIVSLQEQWQTNPPKHPIIVAGSTGSRGATALFMEAVSKLPQGAVVLPGVDFENPGNVWEILSQHDTSDDHPQSMNARMLNKLDMPANILDQWMPTEPFSIDRNKLLSLALRPAPVTDQWLNEGPALIPNLLPATKNLSVIAAPDPKQEANAIATCLRHAAENNKTAVLITPDRMLTRRVSAQLSRWNIIPDDSAGQPLHLNPVGIFLRISANLIGKAISPADLISLLKHPLCHKATDRNTHLRFTRDLELAQLDRDTPIIRGGPPNVDPDLLRLWSEQKRPDTKEWIEWVLSGMVMFASDAPRPMCDWATYHKQILFALYNGPNADQQSIWDDSAGKEAKKIITELENTIDDQSLWSAADYASLLYSIMTNVQLRDAITPHSKISILGTLEARVQGADLVILGGLNEGIWPSKPSPDPWLNRSMRKQIGLLLPERNIGLSAHDFQQAACQKNVILSRSVRDGEAPTIASRWLTRLSNFLLGLGIKGEVAHKQMHQRGDQWLDWARQLDRPTGKLEKAARPSPMPPKTAHPKKLSVTRIKTLVRNPYEIYAQSILNLYPINPYGLEPDALVRGTVFHKIIESYVHSIHFDNAPQDANNFISNATRILDQTIPWPSIRHLWLGRIKRIAPWFVEAEKQRQSKGKVIAQEIKGARYAPELDFTLYGQADRLDVDATGKMIIYDYKSGAPPSIKETQLFDKQLQLEATIASALGFDNQYPNEISGLQYIGLQGPDKVLTIPITDTLTADTWDQLIQLLRNHFEHNVGYGARLKMKMDRYGSDYDQLSRFGEWQETDTPTPTVVP